MKKTNLVMLIAVILFVFFGIGFSAYYILQFPNDGFYPLINLCMYVFVATYAFCEYKTPHGNLMKYLFLLTAVYDILRVAIVPKEGVNILLTLAFCAKIMLVSYMAGRLNRIKQNIVLGILNFLLAVAAFLSVVLSPAFSGISQLLLELNPTLIWLTVFLTYLMRYQRHKAAGEAAGKD